MIREKTPKDLLIAQLSRKLYLNEMERVLLSVTYNLMSDRHYTEKDAYPELIRLIRLLDYEQEGIRDEIIYLESIVFEHNEE
ncbi:hypothetical protein [Oceanobacillus sojae]|uniref:hypothetical protein n=1 Tax=Oceanobacillus sojae TaxID=582851 RepID=UPI0021A283B9|nr:hypothetical protein [Oceanobacillus sojae]MCT1905124.1 hypothetical protein [Oceanobacillus sojae]